MWRRGQFRRLAAAVLAGAAVWVGVSAATSDPLGEQIDVVVTAADVATGHALGASDLQVRTMPADLVPQGAGSTMSDWAGKRVAAPVRAGEVLTDADVSVQALADGQPTGTVVAHIPLPSAALVEAAVAGTRVDIIATSDGSVLATDVLVLGAERDETEGPGLFVALPRDQAPTVARHSASAVGAGLGGSGVTVVVLPSDA